MQKYYFSHAKNALVLPCPGIVSMLKYVIMIATYGGAGTVVYAVMTMEASPTKSGPECTLDTQKPFDLSIRRLGVFRDLLICSPPETGDSKQQLAALIIPEASTDEPLSG